MFPASRGLSRRGKSERKESLSFLSLLPRRERPLLAGKVKCRNTSAFTGGREAVSQLVIPDY